MASCSSDPNLKPEASCGGGNGGGGGEVSEALMENDQVLLYRGLKKAKKERGCTAKERISKMPPCAAGKRSSIYRGVTRHRWTGRYEAHLWDKSTWNQNQNKKGKQVYLGAYDDEEAAARAYDLAALKYWGPGTLINFPVTDYTRDLEEMQNVSREDYLASLRRKSSGFSRGISKYRGISNRWESTFGGMAGSEYFNSIHYGTGDESATNSEYIGSFCVERKIDLTNYIKWWGTNKTRQVDSVGKSPDDLDCELKTLECEAHSSEPYQMPRLGLSRDAKKCKSSSSVSAMSLLSRSSAFKNMQEKALKTNEPDIENDDDNENKDNINKIDYGTKAVEKSVYDDDGIDRLGVALEVDDGSLPPQSNLFPSMPFLSAPLLSNYSSIDPLVAPVLWPSMSLIPDLPAGLPGTIQEVTKTETSTSYTFFQQDE